MQHHQGDQQTWCGLFQEEKEKKKKGAERRFEGIMAENFPNLVKRHGYEQPIKMNSKKPTLRHIIIKLSKARDKESWKQEKQRVMY